MEMVFVIGLLIFGFIAVVVALVAYAATTAAWAGIHAAAAHYDRHVEKRNRRLLQSARREPSPAESADIGGNEASPADERSRAS